MKCLQMDAESLEYKAHGPEFTNWCNDAISRTWFCATELEGTSQ